MGQATADAPAGQSSQVDDALAQIAVEDLDRLLTGAAVERPEATVAAPVAAAAPAPTPPAPAAPPADLRVDQPTKPAVPAAAPVSASVAQQPLVESPAAPAGAAPAVDAAQAVSDAAAGEAEESSDDEQSVPIYLLPLVWLNAPFSELSETARQVIGIAAIGTFLNAIGVLVYIARFRHH